MRPISRIASTALALVAFCAAAKLPAQTFATHPCGESGSGGDHSIWGHMFGNEQACEIRSTTFPLSSGHLNVKGMNGAVEVIGEDRQDIALDARVSAHAGSEAEAASMLHEISIQTGGTVEAHGPQHLMGNKGWSVSYKLHVPHHLAGDFQTMNGGLSLTALEGTIVAETTNGGVSFDRLAGDVHLSTTNGGINGKLDGAKWQGSGLKATTTNGGVSVRVTPNYSAHLVASTVNGGTSVNVAGADQSGVHRRSIDTNLGSGGATLQFETTNGGITIN